MSHFQIEAEGTTVRLCLHGEVTIEQARALQTALVAELRPGHTLAVDAAGATRLDAAALQVLVAAARAAKRALLAASSPAWEAAFRRYAIADPYTANRS